MFKVIPQNHQPPKTNKPLLEVREILWGNTLTHVRHYKPPKSLSIGADKKCDFISRYETIEHDKFYFIKSDKDNRIFLSFTKNMSGVVYFNSDKSSFKALIDDEFHNSAHENEVEIPFKPGMAALYRFGNMQYYIRFVDGEKLSRQPFYKQVEYTINTIMLILLMAYGAMVGYIHSMPEPEIADIIDAEDRRVYVYIKDFLTKIKPPEPKKEVKQYATFKPAHVGAKGKKGKTKSKLDKAKGTAKTKRQKELEVSEAGLLVIGKTPEYLEKFFGGGMEKLNKHLGQLTGYEGAHQRGTEGFGTRGAGHGGDGPSLGLGDGLGTKGLYGKDGGAAIDAGNSNRKIEVTDINTVPDKVIGTMDKADIARVMQKHFSQIKYCYQRELNKDHGLYGKISVSFVIVKDGTVKSSVIKTSTMKNRNVEKCVTRVIKRIVFPEPKGDGQVHVSYPFVFNSEGL